MLIRAERPDDVPSIRALTDAAFATAEHAAPKVDGMAGEAALVDWLRADPAWIPALSLVAENESGDVIGHVVSTRAWIGALPALGLGPISVAPGMQGHGVGSALMRATFAEADRLREPLIGLLGDPRFYGRFGFVPASRLGIGAPDLSWGDFFQAKALAAYDPAARGAFRYAEPFSRL